MFSVAVYVVAKHFVVVATVVLVERDVNVVNTVRSVHTSHTLGLLN